MIDFFKVILVVAVAMVAIRLVILATEVDHNLGRLEGVPEEVVHLSEWDPDGMAGVLEDEDAIELDVAPKIKPKDDSDPGWDHENAWTAAPGETLKAPNT